MRRVSIVGCSGAGKSTLGRALAERLGVPWLELDSVFHQPDWGELPTEEFRATIDAFTAGDGWVVDGNYSKIRDIVCARADTVVWLDLGRLTVLRAVVGRTLRRVVRREELWNGNRERWSNLASLDPHRSIIVWAWTRHPVYRARFAAEMVDTTLAHLPWVRLRTRREVAAFLASAGSE